MKKTLACIVPILLASFLNATDKPKDDAAIKQLEQAISKTNILALSSFLLKAQVQIDNGGKQADGTLQLSWDGPDRWREEIRFPEYNEVQVGGKDTIWVQRSTSFLPYRVHQLYRTLGLGSGSVDSNCGGVVSVSSLVQLGLAANDRVKKVHSQKVHDQKSTCVEIEGQQQRSSEVCINENTGTIIRKTPFQDEDFAAVADKTYPRSLTYTEDGKVVARIKVQEISTPAKFTADMFNPPTGATKRDGCMNPTQVRLVKKVAPEYPFGARQQKIQGTVLLDTWIGRDGVPKIERTETSPSPDLEKSSITAVTQWRYEPATCNGNAVEVETIETVHYTLQVF